MIALLWFVLAILLTIQIEKPSWSRERGAQTPIDRSAA